jgi:hypothetical protein
MSLVEVESGEEAVKAALVTVTVTGWWANALRTQSSPVYTAAR